MAIKPILFNTEMVRAILDGRKTCTRRIVRPPYFVDGDENDKRSLITLRTATKNSSLYRQIGQMPYPDAPYRIGDILYVRETWCKGSYGNEKEKYYYKADDNNFFCTWHPSIHMPKEAARIWLKVTDVRVERLQDITIDDIRGEGLSSVAVHAGDMEIALEEWKRLWNSTIKKPDIDCYGWDANPYVFVIDFIQTEKPEIRF